MRELREIKTGLTQQGIANKLHIDRSTYTNYEPGKTEPPIATILKLCDIFGVSCDELLDPKQYHATRVKIRTIRKQGNRL